MAKTLHDRYCEGLEALGATRFPSRNKYTMLKREEDKTRYFFVGKSGSLRISSRPSATTSLACSNTFKDKVLAAPAKRIADQLAAAGITI